MSKFQEFIKQEATKVIEKNNQIHYDVAERSILQYYHPVVHTDELAQPTQSTKNLMQKLSYPIKTSDVIRSNYVHFVFALFVNNSEMRKKSFGELIVMSIETLLDTDGPKNSIDPYELWIDAGIIDKDLNPIDPTPFAELTGSLS